MSDNNNNHEGASFRTNGKKKNENVYATPFKNFFLRAGGKQWWIQDFC
jgi:hypothetical protein